MKKITIYYNDKKVIVPVNTTFYMISQYLCVDHPLGVVVDDKILSLEERAEEDLHVLFLTLKDVSGYKIYQAGLKFLFEVAIKELYQNSEVKFLHSVPKGILCDVEIHREVTNEDVTLIKEKMNELVSLNEKIEAYHLRISDALNYFKNTNETEKASMVQYNPSDLITMYRLRNRLNYFYNIMPYDTSVLDLFDLVLLGENRIVIVVPVVSLGGKLAPYVNYQNIIDNFLESHNWLKIMNMPYLASLNDLVANYNIKEFILANELIFNQDIMKASREISKRPEIKFVLIAGPSSSGKTTTTKRLSTYFRSIGYDPICISTDDFFVDRELTPLNEKGEKDFESLQAIDLPLFNQTLQKLLNNEEVIMPEYDFIAGKKKFADHKAKLKENSIVLIEGLHSLNDDLLPGIDKKYKYKIYLSPFMPLQIDRHNYVSTLDLRLIRRITRDKRTRGQEVEDTINSWKNVRNGEEKYIFPYVMQADLIINTALSYELGVLKVYALPILYSVKIGSKCFAEARRLIKMLEPFLTISAEFVPKDSIIREFIG